MVQVSSLKNRNLKNLKQCTIEENRIITLKYHSLRFREMSESQICEAIRLILLTINVMTGWPIPTGDIRKNLQDQLAKKINESYINLNIHEIEYAFRHYSTDVENYGAAINLRLFDKVLIPFINKRSQLSAIEEKELSIPVQKIYADKEIVNEQRKHTEHCYQRYLTGNKNYIPRGLIYERLVGDKFIETGSDVIAYFDYCLKTGKKQLYVNENI
jgi:hypothetical protein